MEGLALGVPFSNRTHPGSPEYSSRWTHEDLSRGFREIKSIPAVLLQGGLNQRIFRIDDSEVEFLDGGNSDSKDDKLEVLKAQDDDSEMK